MADFKYSAGIDVNLNVKGASNQLKDLQKQLQQISNMKIDIGTGSLTADIEKASQAAMKLSAHLATATNPQTGNLDFTKFYTSIQKSGASLQEYGQALQNMGPAGQKAFVSLADSISKSEIPLRRTSKLVDGMWDNLKKTVGWQMSSSMVHGFIGSMQQAVGYAKDLNKSLTDIRIVTGASTDQMATFAKEANKAAKNLSTTTTDYTKASLIYYQQGLSDQEVKARTETTIKMANATGTSAQKVSDQMTAIWNNYDSGTKSLTHYADVMTALGAATASSTDEIAEGLQKFAAISDTVGLSYEYAASALATITSTSRESADVVGNSLKTLFSRIQGLQLGETLDDGTTLNKYSTALAKVGISIKDSSGELKDMDLILDEMGNKWETLARDEQMALAQTVAGVRQYTQLMTLMENWDSFKQNLNIANTSGGTLDAQAAIYAESWEAASARVRTSWEGLWDNLINSDGFITALDTVSGLVGILDGMITGLGGAGGALLTFGGALTKVFNKQITGTIQDVAYSISMMTKAGREKVSNERSSFLSSAMEGLDRDNVSALGREYEYGVRQDTIRQSLGLSYDYAKKGDKLSETQLLQYNMQKRALDELQQDSIKAASEYDQALKTRSDLYWKIADNDEIGSGLGSNSKARLEAKLKENELSIKHREDQIKSLGKGNQNKYAKKQLQKEIDETLKPAKDKLTAQLKELADTNTTLTSDILSAGRNTITQNEVVNDLQSRASKSKQIADDILSQYEAKDAQEFLKRDSSNNEELKKAQNEYRKWTGMQSQYLASANRVKNSNVNEINNYSEALINQAKASNQFKMNMQQAFENNDMAAFISGLEEFKETSSNSMKGNGFLKTLTELQGKFNEDGSNVKDIISQQFGDQFLSGLEKFMASSMNKISSAVYDQLSIDDQAKFDSKEDFQSALRDAYSGVEITDTNRKQKAEQAKNLTEKMQQDLDKPYQESQSGTERLVKGAAAAMEALAAGESIKALWTSLADGTATLTSTLSGIASTALNAGSAITGFQSALTGLGGMSAATAGKIGLVITALTALVSTAVELYDRATVSDKEHQQNLINSSNELNSFTATTADHLETVKAQNEDYLEGVKKIKSFDQDPTTLAEDIFESNKKALNLITEYGLTEGQYSTGANGLIEIDENTLKQYGEQAAEQANILSEYANVFGQAKVSKEQAENTLQDFKDSNFADVSSLLDMNNDILSENGKEILREALDTDKDGILDSMSLSGEKISQMIADGTWDSMMKESSIGASHFDDIKALGLEYDAAVRDRSQADLLYDSSLQVLSNKILQDAGYNSANTDGYLAKSGMMSELIQQQVEAQGDWLNTDSTAGLTYEQQEEAAKLIGSQLGVSNIKITGVDEAGQIKYQQGDDESTASTITKESLNSLYAMSEVMKDTNGLVSQVNEKYQDQIDAYGKAGEVVANLDTFDTALGASASAVKEFINNTEAQNAAMTDDQGNIIKKEDGSNLTAGDVFEDSGLKEQYEHILSDDDGIVSQLKLGADVLDNVSMSTLDSLQKVMDVDQSSMEGVKGLFESITSIDNDPEKAAQLLTALSPMDFSSNAYLNASNLLGVLEDLGYGVDEGSLPAIYAWLCAITGLSPGSEDFIDTNNKISKNRGALNGIEPGGKVSGAAKEAAESAGLAGDWVKSGEDEYTYTGTQDQIDAAKSFQNQAWAANQMAIDAAQANKDKITKSGLQGDYDSITALANDLGIGYNRHSGQYVGGNENVDLVEDVLGLNPDTLLNMINSDPQAVMDMVNNMVNNSGISDETQATGAEDFMTNIESAQAMMTAVNEAAARGDTNGFVDMNGIMTEEAINRTQTFEPTSERAAHALEVLNAAQANYAPVAEKYAAAQERVAEAEQALVEQTEGTDEYAKALDELRQAEEARDSIEEYDAVQQAQDQYDLQQAIDATAEARGLDAEAVARQAETIRQALSEEGVGAEGIAEAAADMVEAQEALDELNKSAADYQKLAQKIAKQDLTDPKDLKNLDKMQTLFSKIAGAEDAMIKDTNRLNKAFSDFLKKNPKAMEDFLKGSGKSLAKWQAEVAKLAAMEDLEAAGKKMSEETQKAFEDLGDKMAEYGDQMQIGQTLDEAFGQGSQAAKEMRAALGETIAQLAKDGANMDKVMQDFADATDYKLVPVTANDNYDVTVQQTDTECIVERQLPNGEWEVLTQSIPGAESGTQGGGEKKYYKLVKTGGGGGSGGGGGGGGGGGKEPKKVANKRKSQTVKRYKRNDHKRTNAEKSKKSEENKKDYLYGESKIAQMEKINKLAEKEAKITADRLSESRKYLDEDRDNLIKYMKKYGFEAEFEADGFLANYEEAWTKVYEEIAALYEDNLLTEEEEKIEEELNVKLEELEGALEDYENSLSELAEDIEKYEESLYDMYDSKLEQLEHRLEFRLELNEDDMSYIDFLLEALGDNASKAVDRISLITQKSTALFDNIVRVKENIQAIYDLSDDPFQMWATGGLDIDGLLTEAQVEQLREHRDQLIDYMQELLEMRETIQEEVLNVFDAWTEKIDHNISAIDHYTSVLEHFKNVIDITGKDVFGMSDSFVRSIESAAIDQSMDSIEANKAYYESLVQANTEAEQALQEARARGDTESEEHWEEVIRSTSESMQSAQDALLSALENTLTMISDQFTAAMEDAVEQFNESIYASGGLEGLSNDYSLLREQADLMAEDYDKIYNLTKLTRNINKTLDDTNIIAGKQRLTKLLQEVNDLQKSGVELSKYDLEYLEAKYNLYLAQIELENAQGNKDTVQLSRDSEGNWSYIYTTNEEKVNEAQQKYEDALYEMQNMNHEYMEEMSSSMIETASQMSEEIANLQISDFANLEEYNNKVQEIREKYEQSLNLQNEELNKVIDNNESLYETDWQNYSKYTGYKISADKDWIDSFRETTLGHLMGSESVQSNFNQTIIGLTDTLAQGLSDAAVQYFTQMDTALQTYGSSIDGFSGHIVSMTKTVKEQSDEAAKATESMGERMETAFKDVVTAVKEWQEIEAPKIEEELEAIKTLIEEINKSIRTSAELTTDKDTSIIGSSKAIELINESGLFGSWKINERGDINVSDGAGTETTNFVDYNAKLLEELDDAIELHANGRISDDALAEMFKRYWAYKDIVNRIYDTTNIDAEKELEEKEKELEKKLGGSIKFDTGGYTGEWGHEGKIAMLHEKELVLNANDTSNFLEALNISRQLIEMIEMNARASSLGLGEMVASTIKDTSQTIEQQVSITAEFPNATDHSEIEEAFDNLINIASQYAYRSE